MNFDTLPFYEQLELLIRIPNREFQQLCRVNRTLASICSGQPNADIVANFGPGISEQLYESRVKYHYDEKFLKFRENEMSWREFYNRLTKVIQLINTVPDIQDYFVLIELVENRDLLELKVIQDLVEDKERSIVAIAIAAANIHVVPILKWILSQPRDNNRLIAEIRRVIGDFTTISEAISASLSTWPSLELFNYLEELRASGN